MTSTKLMKGELFRLEKSAVTLEKIVYNYLVELDFVKDRDVQRYEAKILQKLEKLDELQDEIDAIKEMLKEAGEVLSFAGSLNIFKLPEPQVRKQRKPYTPKKTTAKPESRLATSKLWIDACEVMDKGDGTFTNATLRKLTGQTDDGARSRIKKWLAAGLIISSGTNPAVYSRPSIQQKAC